MAGISAARPSRSWLVWIISSVIRKPLVRKNALRQRIELTTRLILNFANQSTKGQTMNAISSASTNGSKYLKARIAAREMAAVISSGAMLSMNL